MRDQRPRRLGTTNRNAAIGLQDAPYLAQKGAGPFGLFEAVNGEQPVDRVVGQRPPIFVDEHGVAMAGPGPDDRTLARRHQAGEARGFGAERAEERRSKACAGHRQAINPFPSFANGQRQLAARHPAERRPIEISQDFGFERHLGGLRGSINSYHRNLSSRSGPRETALEYDTAFALRRFVAFDTAFGANQSPPAMGALDIVLLPCLTDNYCVILHAPETGETAAIDAPSAAAIKAALAERGWRLNEMFITHHHTDHTGGNRRTESLLQRQRHGARGGGRPYPGIDARRHGIERTVVCGASHQSSCDAGS